VLALETRPPGPPWIPLDAAEWRNAGMHALYGAAAASLMTFAVVDVVQFGSVPNGMSLIGVGMLPLVVSLGFAEADVYGFRSECATAMALCFSKEEFSTAARRVLRHRAFAYSTTLLVLTLLVVIPMLVRTGPEPITLLRHLAYGELGVALLGAMLLTSCGLVRPATALLSAGLAVDALVRVPASVSVLTLTMAHTAVFAGLIVAVWWIAFRDLASPLRHR
jgi:hypothetical protein